MEDTIFALASARGISGVAVVRISGPGAPATGAALCRGPLPCRRPMVRWICDPDSGERLDRGLVLAFDAPGSYTGEHVVELQVHGSPATVSSILAVLGRQPGLRQAEPGEFTRRALLNGRLDLAQVEGLGDLLVAETAAQQRQAIAAMSGAVAAVADGWRERLTRALAFVEAGIDFADEELPGDLLAAVARELAGLGREMRRELAAGEVAERIREGFQVALVGRPNVGKSTLLNALARREAALTSETAGTTRDVIEVRLDLRGLPLTLLDMAGLRSTDDAVESVGVARARNRAEAADLRVFLVDRPDEVQALGIRVMPGDYVALAKGDLLPAGTAQAVSGTTGRGIDALLDGIAAALESRSFGAGPVSHARQREMIARAAAHLDRAGTLVAEGERSADLAAEELRGSLRALDALVGRVDVEAVLDVIFRSFCLGK